MLNLEALAELLEKNRASAQAQVREFSIGGQQFSFNSQPAIMGVINLSADSWYRESVCLSTEAAVRRGQVLRAQGAAIIDLGAESTLAHASRADDANQTAKFLPVIRALRAAHIVVSVETYLPAVTRAALEAGASILNLTGTDRAEEMLRMVAAHDAAVILCYVQGKNARQNRSVPHPRSPTYQSRPRHDGNLLRRMSAEKVVPVRIKSRAAARLKRQMRLWYHSEPMPACQFRQFMITIQIAQ